MNDRRPPTAPKTGAPGNAQPPAKVYLDNDQSNEPSKAAAHYFNGPP